MFCRRHTYWWQCYCVSFQVVGDNKQLEKQPLVCLILFGKLSPHKTTLLANTICKNTNKGGVFVVLQSKKIQVVALLLVVATVVAVAVALPVANAAVIKVGSRGTTVKTIQTKLKRWGYYKGGIDGIFGNQTRDAVKYFQRRNGLTADGIVGSATARAMGITLKGSSSGSSGNVSAGNISNNDLYLLSCCVYGEARGESYTGKVAVAAVVLNRLDSSKFPNSISGVIYQKGAFTCVDDGQINLGTNDECTRAAQDALNGWDPTGGALYYFNPKTATSKWIWSRPQLVTIGKHIFCS
ncbi:MAG: spore cortex-lytic enzyme [Clostridia bacterium]|nr:spore cortex-lytic enzyme [Clostridia bacterium]